MTRKRKNKNGGTMEQNGQKQQESSHQQPTTEQAEPQVATNSAQQEQLFAAEQQAQEYLDQLQRTQADFVNYRRRTSNEQANGRIVAQSELLSHLLPVFDDLERALAAVPPELRTHPWVQGLFLVERRLMAQFDQLGVRQIGTSGEPFDPRKHEAIMTETRADMPEGTILQIVQPGYTLGERIIRPAQVSVANNATTISDAPAQQEDAEV